MQILAGIALVALVFAFLLAPFAWVLMLLMDPATAGAYTISYGQSVAITAILSMMGIPFTVKN